MSSLRVGRAAPPALLAAMLLAGCTFVGPDRMTASRVEYNEAVQRSEQLELLLNVVRLRYAEPPEFLGVDGISTQLEMSSAVSLGAELGEVRNESTGLLLAEVGASYSERPTVTLSPQRGGEFTRQLLIPLELDVVELLVRAGWGLDRVLEVAVVRMNGLTNPVSLERTAVRRELGDGKFLEAARLMGELHNSGLLEIARESREESVSGLLPASAVGVADLLASQESANELRYDRQANAYSLTRQRQHFVLRFNERGLSRPEVHRLVELLDLSKNRSRFEIDSVLGGTGAVDESTGSALRIEPRSVLGTLAYLASGVETPSEHVEAGLVESVDGSGRARTTAPRLRVKTSARRPQHGLTVRFRDRWFFVDPSDLESLRTLGMLNYIFRLSLILSPGSNPPVLTLPVGP